MMINRLLSLSIILALLVVLLLFAILTGAATAGARYSDLGIAFGKEIILGAGVYLILVGLVYRDKYFSFTFPILIYILILLFLRTWGELTSALTNRGFSQFDFFFLLSVAGLLVGTSKARNIVEFGVKISATVISISILLIGFSPGLVGVLTIYDATKLEEIGTGSSIFLKNSGILLNNNALGAVMTAMFAYLVFVKSVHTRPDSTNKILVLMLSSVFFSGNGTGSIFCSLLYVYFAVVQGHIIIKKGHYVLTVTSITMFLVALALMTLESSYIAYKLESITAKYNIFFDNLNYLFGSYIGFVFGHRYEAALSESTLIDFLYYFGFPGILLLILLFFSGSLLASRVNSYSRARIRSWPIYLTLFTLLLVQNSAFLPPVCFIFGLLLSYSSIKLTTDYHYPSRPI